MNFCRWFDQRNEQGGKSHQPFSRKVRVSRGERGQMIVDGGKLASLVK